MKAWLGPALLAVLLTLGLLAGWMAKDFHSPTAEYLDQAAQAALEGQAAQANQYIRQAEDRWQRHWKLTAAFTDHDPMDAADQLFARVKLLAEARQWEEMAACCKELSVVLRSVWEDQTLTWWNLL